MTTGRGGDALTCATILKCGIADRDEEEEEEEDRRRNRNDAKLAELL